MTHENSGFSILHPKYSSSNKLKQQHVNFHNFATSWRARKRTQINAERRRNTRINAEKRENTQPANKTNPKPKKQAKTQKTKFK
jgi:hypothetical protein